PRVEALVAEELQALAADGPTESEVEGVRGQAERESLDATSTAERLADELAHYTTLFDDPARLNVALEHLLGPGRGDVHRTPARRPPAPARPRPGRRPPRRRRAPRPGAGADAHLPTGR